MNFEGWSLGAIFKNKWVRLFLILDAIIVIAIVVIMILNARKTVVMNVSVTPLDAKVTLNGHEYKDATFKVDPGEYKIEVSHEGMDTKTFTVNAVADSVVNITTFLSDGGNFDYYTLKDNYPSYYALSQMASAKNNVTMDRDTSAEGFIEEFEKNYQLYRTKLPIDYMVFADDPENMTKKYFEKSITLRAAVDNDDCTKYLCIEAFMVGTEDENLIKALLEEKGMELNAYEIVYRMF